MPGTYCKLRKIMGEHCTERNTGTSIFWRLCIVKFISDQQIRNDIRFRFLETSFVYRRQFDIFLLILMFLAAQHTHTNARSRTHIYIYSRGVRILPQYTEFISSLRHATSLKSCRFILNYVELVSIFQVNFTFIFTFSILTSSSYQLI